jgi:hypothetical protein
VVAIIVPIVKVEIATPIVKAEEVTTTPPVKVEIVEKK